MTALLLLGCQQSLFLVALDGGELELDRARARVAEISLLGCDGRGDHDERYTFGQNLLSPRPARVPRQDWCGLRLDFRALSPLRLQGETADGVEFSASLAPEQVLIEQRFSTREDRAVIALDTTALLSAERLAELAAEQTVDPEEAHSATISADSAEAEGLSLRLPQALWVGSVDEGEALYGERWIWSGARLAQAEEESGGCSQGEGSEADTTSPEEEDSSAEDPPAEEEDSGEEEEESCGGCDGGEDSGAAALLGLLWLGRRRRG